MKCNQHECENPVVFTVHWPGQTTRACAKHAAALVDVANVMGFKLTIDFIDQDIKATVGFYDPDKAVAQIVDSSATPPVEPGDDQHGRT